MSVGFGRLNIIILFHFWEYINGNRTFTNIRFSLVLDLQCICLSLHVLILVSVLYALCRHSGQMSEVCWPSGKEPKGTIKWLEMGEIRSVSFAKMPRHNTVSNMKPAAIARWMTTVFNAAFACSPKHTFLDTEEVGKVLNPWIFCTRLTKKKTIFILGNQHW